MLKKQESGVNRNQLYISLWKIFCKITYEVAVTTFFTNFDAQQTALSYYDFVSNNLRTMELLQDHLGTSSI